MLILLLSLTLVAMCIASCDKGGDEKESSAQASTTTETEAPSSSADDKQPSDNGGTAPDTKKKFTLAFASENASFGTVSAKTADGTSVSSGDTVADGTGVTLTATASTGYSFLGWFDGQSSVSDEAEYTFKMTQNVSLTAKFTLNSHKLNFSAAASFGEVSAQGGIQSGSNVNFGTSVTLTATAFTGYDFEGWYENGSIVENGTSPTLTFSMPDNARTLEARFKAQKRTVTFTDGFDIVHTEAVDYNTAAHFFDMSRNNYTLLGWFVSPDDDAVKFSFDTLITENITLYSKWKADTVIHDVEFIYEDGRRITVQQVADGNELQTPGVESRTGYEFDKWCYYDEASGTYADLPNGFAVRRALTVKAVYKVKTFEVSFYKNKGDATPYHTVSVEYGKTVTTPKTPTDDNYIFTVWVDENGERFALATPITEAITLYGAWETMPVTSFNVDFYREADDADYIDRKIVEDGKTVSLPSSPEKEGHRFIGWYYNDGTEKQFTEQTVISAAVKAYAKYEILTFGVTFTDHDGRVLKAEQTVNWGASAIAPANPERDGYTFDGWDIAYNSVKEDLTVKAKWKIITFDVTYYDGDDEIGAARADYGTTLSVPKTPEKAGYSFIGWYKDEGLTSKFDFASTVIDKDTEIYARFDKIEVSKHTVAFKLPDGSVISEQTVVEGNSAIAPGNPKVTGYTFLRWDKSFDNITEPTVVTAVFEKNKYTVRFFDYNGEQIGQSQTVEYMDKAISPMTSAIPCPDNKQFTGWDKNVDSYGITNDTDFYARYALETRDVTFYVDGQILNKTAVEYGSQANIPNTPVKAGYVFKYWRLVGESTAYDFSTQITENTELEAAFEKLVDIWTVTFKAPNGTQVGYVQFVATNGKAMEPAPYDDGTNAEYEWCLEGNEQPFDFDNTAITEDIVLVARLKNN